MRLRWSGREYHLPTFVQSVLTQPNSGIISYAILLKITGSERAV